MSNQNAKNQETRAESPVVPRYGERGENWKDYYRRTRDIRGPGTMVLRRPHDERGWKPD